MFFLLFNAFQNSKAKVNFMKVRENNEGREQSTTAEANDMKAEGNM